MVAADSLAQAAQLARAAGFQAHRHSATDLDLGDREQAIAHARTVFWRLANDTAWARASPHDWTA